MFQIFIAILGCMINNFSSMRLCKSILKEKKPSYANFLNVYIYIYIFTGVRHLNEKKYCGKNSKNLFKEIANRFLS